MPLPNICCVRTWLNLKRFRGKKLISAGRLLFIHQRDVITVRQTKAWIQDGQTDEPTDSHWLGKITLITICPYVFHFFSSPISFSAFYAGPLSAVMVHLDQLFPDQPTRSIPQHLLWFLIKKNHFETILLNSDFILLNSDFIKFWFY